MSEPAGYVLGHSDHELGRLQRQATRIDPFTRRFFQEAGVRSGMRALDVGCGAGDVSMLVADLVGPAGEVIGVDRSSAAVETARARASARSLAQVSFVTGDPSELSFDQPFDAVVGRYVLQFQKDPSTMLRRLAAHVRPGGLVVFHEIDWHGVESVPPVPTFDRACEWMKETLRGGGAATRPGTGLHATFLGAGLPVPEMRLEAMLGGGSNSIVLEIITDLVATLLPEMERLGIATTEDVGLPTLHERMASEALAHRSVFVGHYQVAAWTRV